MKAAFELTEPALHPLIVAAFNGDVDAARELALSLPAEIAGEVLIHMFSAQIPKPAFRAYLQTAWSSSVSRVFVMGAHGAQFPANQVRANLARLFAYAEFARPEGLLPQIRVYRATHSISAEVAATGLHWNANLQTAKMFAFYFTDKLKEKDIRIVSADVSLDEITYFVPDSAQEEVILIWPPSHFIELEVKHPESIFDLILPAPQVVAVGRIESTRALHGEVTA